MIAERIYIVDAEFFNDESGKLFQVHPAHVAIPVGICRAFNKSPKRPGGHRKPVARCGWKVQLRRNVPSLGFGEEASYRRTKRKLL